MSHGQKPRNPAFFPAMKYRAWKRHRPRIRVWSADWRVLAEWRVADLSWIAVAENPKRS